MCVGLGTQVFSYIVMRSLFHPSMIPTTLYIMSGLIMTFLDSSESYIACISCILQAVGFEPTRSYLQWILSAPP